MEQHCQWCCGRSTDETDFQACIESGGLADGVDGATQLLEKLVAFSLRWPRLCAEMDNNVSFCASHKGNQLGKTWRASSSFRADGIRFHWVYADWHSTGTLLISTLVLQL